MSIYKYNELPLGGASTMGFRLKVVRWRQKWTRALMYFEATHA